MAITSSTTLSTSPVASAALRVRTHKRRSPKLKLLPGLNAYHYQGLVAHNNVVAMGVPVSTEQCFSKIVSSIRPNSGTKKGGALSATCNAAGEIFRIAAIMNGLVLVGVAVGFVLLRIEASLEESESDK